MTRLSTTKREQLYDAEALKAREAGKGDLPICNICGASIDGVKQAWDVSHDPDKPNWLGGEITGIAHRRCNRDHNNKIDTPRFAKSNRQRQMNIGAKARTGRPMVGTRDSNVKLSLRPFARPIDRTTGREI